VSRERDTSDNRKIDTSYQRKRIEKERREIPMGREIEMLLRREWETPAKKEREKYQ
jgi:hypothetical protein